MAANKFVPGGVKGFFWLHVEKVVLGVCVALVALFFCLGWSVESIKEDQTPAALFRLVDQGSLYIARDSWEDIGPSREITPNHKDRVEQSRRPIDESYYAMDQYWLWPKFPLEDKRTDPVLYPPQHVIARAFIVPVATAGAVDRMAKLPDAFDEPPKEPQIRRPAPRPRRRRPVGDEEADLLDDEEIVDDVLDEEMLDESSSSVRRRKVLSQPQREEFTQGTFVLSQAGTGAVVEGKTLVAVTCVVPYRKQYNEFENCFLHSMGYDPGRDRPEYFFYVAERAEVTPGDPIDPTALKWKIITNTTHEHGDPGKLRLTRVKVEELVDEGHLHPALTSPTPAALLVPAVPFATHPDVKFKTLEELAMGEVAAEEDAGPTGPGGPLAGAPGALGGAPGAAVRPPMDEGDLGDGLDEGLDDGLGDDLGDDVGDGGDGEMDRPAAPLVDDKADKLLVRFYDEGREGVRDPKTGELIGPQRGKSYVYRVKVFVRDPNNPIESQAKGGEEGAFNPNTVGGGHPPVPDRMLAGDAITRVKEARAKNIKYRETEFSEPSAVVTVPDLPQQLVAGAVEPAQYMPLDNFKILRNEAKAEVLTVLWDDDLGVFIPGLTKARRGAVLNFNAGANVLHPLQMVLKRLEEHNFRSDAVLLDIRGGDNLGSSKKPLQAPGEILMVDRDGRLIVRNEIDDADVYRRQLFIEDRGPNEPLPPAIGDDGGLGDDLDGGLDDLGSPLD